MKNYIICILLVIATGLSAQSEKPIEKGQLMVGGSGAFAYGIELTDTDNTNGEFSISLSPSVGLFVSHGFALGVSPTIYFSSIFGDYTDTYTGFGLGFFLAKYFDIGLFVKGTLEYDFISINRDYYEDPNRSHHVSIIPEVGYAFFLGPNVALELAIKNQIRMDFSPDQSAQYNSRTYFSAGFQIFL